MTDEKTPRDTLLELIEDIPVAMVTTLEADGSLRARPMAPERLDDDPDHLYFVTRRSSHKVIEISADPHVGLAFAKGAEHVSVSGKAEISTDAELIERLWSEAQRLWFPAGPGDPDIAILKVSIDYGEYWDRPGGASVMAYGWAKAMLTGQDVEGELGKNEKIGHPG